MDQLQVHVLGHAQVFWHADAVKFPTQKSLAMALFLAVSATASSREVLTELLWETGTAAKLRAEVSRLKKLPFADACLTAADSLELTATTDLSQFENAIAKQDYQTALDHYQGDFLAGFELKQAPAFADWLELERQRLVSLYLDALAGHAENLTQAGNYAQALVCVNTQLTHDPLNETAYRQGMRLEYRRGEVQRALSLYDRCRRVLREELDIEPLAETQQLARVIQQGDSLPQYEIRARPRIPEQLLRPPVLIGRDKAWQTMETAWQAGQSVQIAGQTGLGKSRLVNDFMSSKGGHISTAAQAADRHMPLSTLTRAFRLMAGKIPDLQISLPAWVRHELATILPELLADGLERLPTVKHLDEAGFYLIQTYFKHARGAFGDDLHWMDAASFDQMIYYQTRLYQSGQGIRSVVAFREQELPETYRQAFNAQLEAGLAVKINLHALTLAELAELVSSLGFHMSPAGLDRLYQLTGGTPQLVVESLKALCESGQLQPGSSKPGPTETTPANYLQTSQFEAVVHHLPDHVELVLKQRLEDLAVEPLRVIRVLAILSGDITVEVLAEVVELDVFTVSQYLAELETRQLIRSQMIRGQTISAQSFVHDLLRETVRQHTPPAVARLLHGKLATALEQVNSEPAHLAHHWLAAGHVDKAHHWRYLAADVAFQRGARTQAQQWLSDILAGSSVDSELYAKALILQGLCYQYENLNLAQDVLTQALVHAERHNDELEAWALEACARQASLQNRNAEALELLDRASSLDTSDKRRAGLLHLQAIVLRRLSRFDDAERLVGQAMQLDDSYEYHLSLAFLYWHQGRFTDIIRNTQKLLKRVPNLASVQPLHNVLGNAYWVQGELNLAASHFETDIAIWHKSEYLPHEALSHMNYGTVLTLLGRYDKALSELERAHALFAQLGDTLSLADTETRQALLYQLNKNYLRAYELSKQAANTLQGNQQPFLLVLALAQHASSAAYLAKQQADTQLIDEASSFADDSLELARTMQHPFVLATVLNYSSDVQRQLGNTTRAQQDALESTHLCEQHAMAQPLAVALSYYALASEGNSQGVQAAEAALELARQQAVPQLILYTCQFLEKYTDQRYSADLAEARAFLIAHTPASLRP